MQRTYTQRAALSALFTTDLPWLRSVGHGDRGAARRDEPGVTAPNGDWIPTPFLRFSAHLHALSAATATVQPEGLAYLAGLLALDQLIVFGAGLHPRSQLLGSNLTRLPAQAASRGEVAITFDDGPDPEVTPRVLDLLDRYQARASFFCIARRARQWPGLTREIVQRGHRVENHSYFHHAHRFGFHGVHRLSREIGVAQQALERITGRAPCYLRTPVGIRNLWLDAVLVPLGLKLVSWTRRGFDTASRDPRAIAARLLKGLSPGDILLLHDGRYLHGARGNPIVLEVLPRLLDAIAERGLRPVAIDPS